MNAYVRPTALTDALTALVKGEWRILAGGTDLYPAAGARLAADILDITAIEGITTLSLAGDLRIGAGATWSDVAEAALPPACRALQQAARLVGGRQIQNAGTIGGNLCNASPAADGVPALLVLDAQVELASLSGIRRLPLGDFLQGPRQTARRPDEILTAIIIPEGALTGQSAFVKLGARAYLVISIAMVAARMTIDGGRIAGCALAVGACSATARRLPTVEAALLNQPVDRALSAVSATDVTKALAPIDDIRASAEYRQDAAFILVRSAVEKALA